MITRTSVVPGVASLAPLARSGYQAGSEPHGSKAPRGSLVGPWSPRNYEGSPRITKDFLIHRISWDFSRISIGFYSDFDLDLDLELAGF